MTYTSKLSKPGKPKRYTEQTFCSNGYCPRVSEIEIPADASRVDTVALLAISKSEAICDGSGHYWCQQCKWRADVLDWGKLHNWPTLKYFPYAVAQGQMFWELAIKMGVDAYVQALQDAIRVAEEI